MALQTKTKAALDASAFLADRSGLTFQKFLQAVLKNTEALTVELENLRNQYTGSSDSDAGSKDSAVSIGLIGAGKATDLRSWSRVLRSATEGLANELALLAATAPNNHTHVEADITDLHKSSDLIITDVTGLGTISGKTYFDSGGTSPANAQLTAAESDNDSITVAFTVFARGTNWQPLTVTSSGAGTTGVISTNGTWSQAGSGRVFTGTLTITDADTDGTITITDSDGATATFAYTRGADPVVLGGAIAESISHLGRSNRKHKPQWTRWI